MFFGDWLQRRGMLSPSRVALVDAVNKNQRITYEEWNQRANRLANFMYHGLEIRKSDRVSVYAMNRVEYLDALFACNKLGAILHVVNWRLQTRELEGIISDAAPRAVFYSQEFSDQVLTLRPRLNAVAHWIALDHAPEEGDALWPAERHKYPP
nr:AMP-binding protein [Chloroflexota bacterium]